MMNPKNHLIQQYWDEHIHDLSIATQPIGSAGFFQELANYRYEKLDYLNGFINSSVHQGKVILEIGCGVGIDLICLTKSGALVYGIDFSSVAIKLARNNLEQNGLQADVLLMDGETLGFSDHTFDIVYAHGVLQYTSDDNKMVAEIHRVLKPNGQAIMMFYNKFSWLNALSRLTSVGLEHADAPILRKYSIDEVKRMLHSFRSVQVVPERFPVATRLHKGTKARLYNDWFVKIFNMLPRSWVRPFGWHLMVFATKA
jgi:ubiquinone/menaquinone biosynthesis C-methylase UbiE